MADRAARFKGTLTLDAVGEEPEVKRSGVDLAPYAAVVQASWDARETDKPSRGATIPTAAKTLTEGRFREAANTLTPPLGVSVSFIDHGEAGADRYNLQPGQSRIIVQAREKKARPGTKKNAANGGAAAPAKASGLPQPPKKAGK